eukprot:m.1461302 g.1461302  ORF g.1461302 m.1461302 type:complete len:54 (-) comp25131_c0_seq9:1436-1597(-)
MVPVWCVGGLWVACVYVCAWEDCSALYELGVNEDHGLCVCPPSMHDTAAGLSH